MQMYQAELKGKLPPSASDREDVLTSNVFSFLKYSHRPTYLRQFLRLAGLEIPAAELCRISFAFWPTCRDGTEPNVVIETNTHYVLVEAKYFSGVGEENGNPAGQLIRECQAGAIEASNRSKSFRLLLITGDATRPSSLLAKIPDRSRENVSWTNWQAIAQILLKELETSGTAAPDHAFANDLYELLDFKHLRGFLSFTRLAGIRRNSASGHIFFAAETASFRGAFIGFAPTLSVLAAVPTPPVHVFYSADTRFNLPTIKRPLFQNHIFFPPPHNEQRP